MGAAPHRSHSVLGRLLVASLGGIVLFLALFPPSLLARTSSICVFKNLFEIECAGCGMTRALSALLHGDVPAAMAHNPGALFVLPLMLAVLIVDLLRLLPTFRRMLVRFLFRSCDEQ